MIYRLPDSFPPAELFGLTSQPSRSAVSIPTNIAKGKGRHTDSANANPSSIPLGFHAKLETVLEIARVLGFVSDRIVKDTRNKRSLIWQKRTPLRRYLKRIA